MFSIHIHILNCVFDNFRKMSSICDSLTSHVIMHSHLQLINSYNLKAIYIYIYETFHSHLFLMLLHLSCKIVGLLLFSVWFIPLLYCRWTLSLTIFICLWLNALLDTPELSIETCLSYNRNKIYSRITNESLLLMVMIGVL